MLIPAPYTIAWLLVSLATSPVSASTVSAWQPPPVAGCYQSSITLGPVGTVSLLHRDSAFQTFVLTDSGTVQLPLLESRQVRMWTERSTWQMRRDTLRVRVSTGLQGWEATVTLGAKRTQWHGTAQYLSDAIVRGQPPLRAPVVFVRIPCRPVWLKPPVDANSTIQ